LAYCSMFSLGPIIVIAIAIVTRAFAGSIMHPTAKFQFERAAREFAQWRAVPESERSPAPAWWWQPAFEVIGQQGEMAPLWCHRLELPIGSTYAAGAAVLIATLADQTFLPRPDEFPIKNKSETSATHQPETPTDPGVS
jgi:hypothetical protein